MMKTIVDTPEFTAWLLGELPHEQASAMERTVAADPALQLAAREQQQFLQSFSSLMGGAQETLDARQREKIMSAARTSVSDVIVAMPQKRSSQSWGWISLATAAVAVVGVWIGVQNPLKLGKDTVAWDEVTREIALLASDAPGFPEGGSSNASQAPTAVGGNTASAQRDALLSRQPDEFLRVTAQRIAAEPLPTAAELPLHRERGFVDASSNPRAPLPLHVSTASWNWIKRSIAEQHQLPHPSLVRAEEIINSFRLGTGQELQHNGCVLRADQISLSSQRSRLIVSLRNESNSSQSVQWSFMPPSDSRYRLVGFGSASSSTKTSQLLAAGASVTIMLEVDMVNAANGLGELMIASGGTEQTLPIVASPQPSQDAAFFSLLVDYTTWLRQPQEDSASLKNAVNAMEYQSPTAEQLMALSIMKKSLLIKKD